MAGLDPATAWDRTPGELIEVIAAYRERMERQCYCLYNLAGTIAHMVLSSRKPDPWDCFPGWIEPRRVQMTDDEIYQSCLAWCGMTGTEAGA